MLLTTSTRAHTTSFEFWVCMRFTFLHLFFLFPLPLGAKSETNFNEIPFGAWIAHAGMAKMSLPYQHIFMRKKDPLSRRLTYVRSETERSEFGISSRRSRALKVRVDLTDTQTADEADLFASFWVGHPWGPRFNNSLVKVRIENTKRAIF